jgi:hypothetical protein
MRPAILAAEQSARSVFDTIARRISQRRLSRLDDELELTAGTTAIQPIAPAVRAELMAAEMQRKSHLLHFDAAELDAACRLPFTGARPAITDG